MIFLGQPTVAARYWFARVLSLVFGGMMCYSGCSLLFADELKDIRGPVAIPGDYVWFWVLLVVMVGIVALLFLQRKRGLFSLPPIVSRPPWEIALEELSALQKKEHSGPEQVKWFYSRLSEIIRVYIERRFEIRAPEMTTEEFLETAYASTALQETQKKSLRDLLNASDLVKFAKTIPAEKDVEDALQLARRFIEETQIQPPLIEQQSVR